MVQGNFQNYEVLRIDEMAVVEVHLVEGAANPGGIGEASTPSIIPPSPTPVFAATTERVRKLPRPVGGFSLEFGEIAKISGTLRAALPRYR